ncbi:MAG: PD-(D/E)XK nuclease family protein [Armatimonadetes bacterium]|nr:PD-(D/E)XK nuclease family protein [Armatimonadota bacterium]
MARKPSLSPSKITTYLACPDKYKWTYVDDRGKWYMRSKSYFSFGSTLHKVLQRFHDSGDSGVTTTSQALAALDESWIEAGYASQDDMMQAMAEGKDIIESYVEAVQAKPVTAETIYIEKLLRADLGEFVLIGRVDRVDEHEDGTLEIIDYKTGRDTVSAEDVEADMAMSCYQLLLSKLHPNKRIVATIIALRSGGQATSSMSQADLQEFESDLVSLRSEIHDRDFEGMTPVPKSLCPSCDFLPLCSRHEDFELPAAESEPATPAQ